MKLLFLDLDGVLNSHDTLAYSKNWPDEHLDPFLIEYLNQIIEQTGAKVVISSSWRCALPWNELAKVLANRGFKGEVISQTPIRGYGTEKYRRREEIKEWMEDFDGKIDSFVILEDYECMKGLGKHVVRTCEKVGLTPDNVKRAIRILNDGPVVEGEK